MTRAQLVSEVLKRLKPEKKQCSCGCNKCTLDEEINTTPLVISEGLQYHLTNNIPLVENIYRYGSDKFVSLLCEVRLLWENQQLDLESAELQEMYTETDLGKVGLFHGEIVPLDLPLEEAWLLQEAEYQGKHVDLNKPKRGGSKKFYVYTKNPKTGKIIKVNFGAKEGGQNLAVKFKDPARKKAFAERHNCKDKKDKTKPGYWSCRLPRYWKSLGGDKNYSGWW